MHRRRRELEVVRWAMILVLRAVAVVVAVASVVASAVVGVVGVVVQVSVKAMRMGLVPRSYQSEDGRYISIGISNIKGFDLHSLHL